MLTERLVSGLMSVPGVRIYGLTEREDLDRRVATVSLRKEGDDAGTAGTGAGGGEYFCVEWGFLCAVAAREDGRAGRDGGWLRLGLVHYNTVEEIERCLGVLEGSF